jgi:hypothetical protein
MGVKEYRAEQRAERNATRAAERASRMAERFGVTEADVLALLNDTAGCDGDWQCVRQHFLGLRLVARFARQYGVSQDEVQAQLDACSGDWDCAREYFLGQRTAERLAAQYGADVDHVMDLYANCAGDWSCVRAELRDEFRGERGGGPPEGKGPDK